MSTTSRYVVGIDLGTTHSVMAYLDTSLLTEEGPPPVPQLFEVPQVVLPGQVEARPLLPSFLYLAAATDFPARALDLPWPSGQNRSWVVGEVLAGLRWSRSDRSDPALCGAERWTRCGAESQSSRRVGSLSFAPQGCLGRADAGLSSR